MSYRYWPEWKKEYKQNNQQNTKKKPTTNGQKKGAKLTWQCGTGDRHVQSGGWYPSVAGPAEWPLDLTPDLWGGQWTCPASPGRGRAWSDSRGRTLSCFPYRGRFGIWTGGGCSHPRCLGSVGIITELVLSSLEITIRILSSLSTTKSINGKHRK